VIQAASRVRSGRLALDGMQVPAFLLRAGASLAHLIRSQKRRPRTHPGRRLALPLDKTHLHISEVPFDPEVAEERGTRAEVQDMLAPGGVGDI